MINNAGIISPLISYTEYIRGLEVIKSNINKKDQGEEVCISGVLDSQKTLISYGISSHLGIKGIFVASNEMEAKKAYEDLYFLAGDDVVYYPSKEIILFDIEAKSNGIVFQRLNSLNRILQKNFKIAVVSIDALIQRVVSRDVFVESCLNIDSRSKYETTQIALKLLQIGYERVGMVEAKGQFAVRGGIIDIFPINLENAVRIELFDDEIDSIRTFDSNTQRSIENILEVRIIPAIETLYSDGIKDSISEKIQSDISKYIKKLNNSFDKGKLRQIEEKLIADLLKLKTDYHFPGIDRLIPYIMHDENSIIDYIIDPMIIFLDEIKRINERIDVMLFEHKDLCERLVENGKALPSIFSIYLNKVQLNNIFSKNYLVNLNPFTLNEEKQSNQKHIDINVRSVNSYAGYFEMLLNDIKNWIKKKYKILILAGTKGKGEHLVETLNLSDVLAVYTDDLTRELQSGHVVVTCGRLNSSFEFPQIGFVIISDSEVFGKGKWAKKHSSKKSQVNIDLFTQLAIGDYIVHQNHGIGQYVALQTLLIDGVTKDYIKIRYLGDSFLYIPITQLDLIQKYIGSEGSIPRLNKLGTSEWSKSKARVKESLFIVAKELVSLHAKRGTLKGFAFSKDTIWQHQFEESFPYEETDDQLKCINEIKIDMESEKPMDRLLCGDVGYGKTEVALRAIFKAVMDGKQVAYLVPTTVLAQQHFNNFIARMKDFGVQVDLLSRFRTKMEQKKVVEALNKGMVDVLVGTHRILQTDLQFKNLGLLVIDEEQRFGVMHKEKIKNLKPNVDILTLTATPIPRTLHMSLVGIRDISVIEEPPKDRYPVQTYVMEYNIDVIRDAIIREIARGGQVFYLFNKVKSIQFKASQIAGLVPDAKVLIAHGQMQDGQLENSMTEFLEGKYDVLVCTTIIESGLDMPNVNTIIVENADNMGLAQLYQLRGRVGRSNKLAYAYITHKKDKVVSEVAQKRLQAIRDFTEFGSGFKVAMKDLEIRGAGNLIGKEQHGQMETVGYDMYCRLLEEAVKEIKGETKIEEYFEIAIDLDVNAYIESSYISEEDQKINIYKKIAAIADDKDMHDIKDELLDRFGSLPLAVLNLIDVAIIKSMARKAGVNNILQKNDSILICFAESRGIDLKMLSILIGKYKKKLLYSANDKPYLTYKVKDTNQVEILGNIKILLQDIKKLQEAE